MNTIVDETSCFTTIILDGIFIIKINYKVVSFVSLKLLNVVTINSGGLKGSIDSCSLSIFNTAIISVSNSSLGCDTNVAFGASAVSFEKCSSLSLILSHFIPFSQIVVDLKTLSRWRNSTAIA
jgi:hypothetical protein